MSVSVKVADPDRIDPYYLFIITLFKKKIEKREVDRVIIPKKSPNWILLIA